jgi:hypothetical protein
MTIPRATLAERSYLTLPTVNPRRTSAFFAPASGRRITLGMTLSLNDLALRFPVTSSAATWNERRSESLNLPMAAERASAPTVRTTEPSA